MPATAVHLRKFVHSACFQLCNFIASSPDNHLQQQQSAFRPCQALSVLLAKAWFMRASAAAREEGLPPETGQPSWCIWQQ